LFRAFGKFLSWGIILNLLGLLLFSGFIALGTKAESASIIVSLILLPLAFAANKNIVFRDTERAARARYRFVIVYSIVVAINYLYLRIVLENFRIHELIAQLTFLSVVVVGSFVVQKFWVFRSN
jgi:putative flippase GtrA